MKSIDNFLAIITTIVFIPAFFLNVTSNSSIYNQNLNIVPDWQTQTWMSNSNFIDFMNIVSNLFNPIVCAAYIGIFWIISSKKLQIMVFLVWFIFLSFVAASLKMIFGQARPYWIKQSSVKMLQWTCYTEYGMPSGHAFLGLVLIEFIIRFFVRNFIKKSIKIIILYIAGIILHLMVMFSRVILGMHSFNQVLFGASIGLFSISVYYLTIQKIILTYFHILITARQRKDRIYHTKIIIFFSALSILVTSLIAFIPERPENDRYFNYIITRSKCQSVQIKKSFQYRCLEDCALIMANAGIFLSLLYMKSPQNLTKKLDYNKISFKFLKKILIMMICGILPVIIFMNPLWNNISDQPIAGALIIWICQIFSFSLALFFLLTLSPIICSKFNLQTYTQTLLYRVSILEDRNGKSQLEIEGQNQSINNEQ